MAVSHVNQESDSSELYFESQPPALFKTAFVGESLLILFSTVAIGAFAALCIASSPLPLFLASAALPVAACFAIIFNDPYYEDPLKREHYGAEISRLGLEAFIEKHGWERLERYGFCFSGRSPLITKEAYTKAFFDEPRSVDSSLIWRGLERNLFLDESLDALAEVLLNHISELIDDGRIWTAHRCGVFNHRKDALVRGLSKFMRCAEGYDILAIWTHLSRGDLVPEDFPLAPWAKRNCGVIDAFESRAKLQREQLRKAYLESKAQLEESAEAQRGDILCEKEPDLSQLRGVVETLERDLKLLHENYMRDLGIIAGEEATLRSAMQAEFESEKAAFDLYFSFDSLCLQELIEIFGIDGIERSRLESNFPSESEWSEKFITESDPPLWVSLEKGLLDAKGRARAEALIVERLEGPWDIAEKSAVLRAIDLGIFEDKTALRDLLSTIEPMHDPLRLLHCYSSLQRRSLIPHAWSAYPWLAELGPQFVERSHYFDVGYEDPFLQMQQERWHRDVLEMIYGVVDQVRFQSDLQEMPLKGFVDRYGWDCITQLCLDAFAKRFFIEFSLEKEQLASGLLWPLVESGVFSEAQKEALESALLDNLPRSIEGGDVQQALAYGLFEERSALREAIDAIDPREERALLIAAWPWLRVNGLLGENLHAISSWFDRSARSASFETGFEEAYATYQAQRDWREKTLVEWGELYGKEQLLSRVMQERSLIDRWEREDPLWSSDQWNWILFERGLLSDAHVRRWMQAWIERHPTFREKVLSPDFAKAFRLALFSEEDLKVIAASFHHPSTFLIAEEFVQGLDWISDLQITFTPEEKLLYTWIKNHQSWYNSQALERAFADYKREIGWRGSAGFDFELENKDFSTAEGEGLFKKIFMR